MDLMLPIKKTANGQKYFFKGAKLWIGFAAKSKQASSLNKFSKHYLIQFQLYFMGRPFEKLYR